MVNPSLTEKLRRDLGLEFPGDWAWEDKPVDVELGEVRGGGSGLGWSVRWERCSVVPLSFQKYVMYRDLLDNERRSRRHPIVSSLARLEASPRCRLVDATSPHRWTLDAAQPPPRTLSILDSDATQRQRIEAARRGQSFVMHGPPGTGKSQTIANVIADAIGSGRTRVVRL